MKLHTLKPSKGSKHSKVRLGRGRASGKGKTSGHGHKGQMARSGANHRVAFEGGQMPLYRRLPKRGFNHQRAIVLVPVNISSLNRFDSGTEVTFELLQQAGLASGGKVDGVKILGNGTLEKKLVVKAQAFSASAVEKIKAAGGECTLVS